MPKIIIFLLAFCLVLGNVFAHSSNDRLACSVAKFRAEVGTREASGRNDGARVEQYLASCKLKKGHAWCGAFVNYCRSTCGMQVPVNGAWASAWFTNDKVIWEQHKALTSIPETGDLFGLYFPSHRRIAHIGFIDMWNGSSASAITVEGNTNMAGSREGDGVYRKRRLKSQLYKVARWS